MTPRVLELRVHGVHGTPVNSMLGVGAPSDTRRVRGDSKAGIYEAVEPEHTSGPPLPPGATRQAYFWGALTSPAGGAVQTLKRAGWLTLVPFALVNLAMWSRPAIGTGGKGAKTAAVLLRLAGLLLTALLVTTACGIGIDLLAWQCFREGVPQCSRIPGSVEAFTVDHLSAAEQRVALGQLVPLAALAVIAWLSLTSTRSYEHFQHPMGSGGGRPDLLSKPTLWQGEQRLGALLSTHLGFGLAVLVAYTAWAAPEVTDEHEALWVAVLVLAIEVAVAAAGVTVWGVWSQPEHQPGPGPDGGPPADPTRAAARVVLLAAAALTAGQVWLLLSTDIPVASEAERLRGVGAFPSYLVVALFLLVACLVGVHRAPELGIALPATAAVIALVVFLLTEDEGPRTRFWWMAGTVGACVLVGVVLHKLGARPGWAWDGAAPAVLLGAALGTAVLFSSGLTLVVADLLNGPPRVSALKVDLPATQPRADVLVVGSGTTLQDGWLDLRQSPPTLQRGMVRTPTLTATTPGAVPRSLSSRVLETDVTLQLPEGLLLLDRVCLVAAQGAPQLVSSATLPLDQLRTAPEATRSAAPPAECDSGAVLDAPVRAVTTRTATPLAVPAPYMWFAATLPVLALMLALLAGWLIRGRHWVHVRKAVRDFAIGPTDGVGVLPGRLRDRCLKARSAAALAHRAERLIEVLTLAMLTTGVLITAGVLCDAVPGGVESWFGALTTIGLFLNVVAAAGLLYVGSQVRSSFSLRRTTGVLWDLSTFFPRVAHPFAPPCYGERVVPELTSHLTCALEDGGHVVLSAHSQGSTISAAVLMQLDARDLERVRFITYGSQLRSWFGRIFPVVLGPAVLGNRPTTSRPHFGSAEPDVPPGGSEQFTGPESASLAGLLDVQEVGGRWVSLFRRTDPLGFRVWSDHDGPGNPVDRVTREWSEVPLPIDRLQLPQTHGDYPATPEYDRVVGAWFAELLPVVIDLDDQD